MTDDWVGKPRVYKAQETLQALNPDIEIDAVCEYVSADNIDALVQQADIALDCAFDFKERDLLNTACVRQGQTDGRSGHERHGSLPHHHCAGRDPLPHLPLYPEKPEWDRWGFGVLGAVSGTLACLAALEAIKLITGLGEPLLGYLLTMDLARAEFAKRRSYHDPDCPVCGPRSRDLEASQHTDQIPTACC
jgi:molybdopterin/thiamine biosynthesis adenylyltransferase